MSQPAFTSFEQADYGPTTTVPPLSVTLGEELLRPTHIYVRELELLERRLAVKAMKHITGDGFTNLTRVASETSYVIEWLPESAGDLLAEREGG